MELVELLRQVAQILAWVGTVVIALALGFLAGFVWTLVLIYKGPDRQ